MSLTKWLIPLEWASQCSKKETPGCSFLSPARPPHQGRSSSSSSQWNPWYIWYIRANHFAPEWSSKVLLSVTESIGNVRSHQKPDFKTRFQSQQSSCLCTRCPSWKMNMSCWPCNILLWIEEWSPKYVLQLLMKLSLLNSCQWRFC